MKDHFGDIGSLVTVFRFAWNASSELGKWCADRAWMYALADDVLPKLEGQVSKAANMESSGRLSENAYKEIERIKAASDIVKNHPFCGPNSLGALSPKVQLLRKELGKYFETPSDTKCIIFTEMRYTARVLFELFSELNMPHLRPGVLIGVRSSDITGMNITFRKQLLAMVKFRKGDINCLVSKLKNKNYALLDNHSLQFATSVAEEGLDIPDCNLVVRYTSSFYYIFDTVTYYLQGLTCIIRSFSTFKVEVEPGILIRQSVSSPLKAQKN